MCVYIYIYTYTHAHMHQVGRFIEVKWKVDWWQATIKKVRTDTTGIRYVYVCVYIYMYICVCMHVYSYQRRLHINLYEKEGVHINLYEKLSSGMAHSGFEV